MIGRWRAKKEAEEQDSGSGRIVVDGIGKSTGGRARTRILITMAVFFAVYGVIAGRLTYLGFQDLEEGGPGPSRVTASRPDIVDRNGEVLATDINTASLYAEPRRIVDADEAPRLVLDADAFLRAVLSEEPGFDPYTFCHRPIVSKNSTTPIGKLLRKLEVEPTPGYRGPTVEGCLAAGEKTMTKVAELVNFKDFTLAAALLEVQKPEYSELWLLLEQQVSTPNWVSLAQSASAGQAGSNRNHDAAGQNEGEPNTMKQKQRERQHELQKEAARKAAAKAMATARPGPVPRPRTRFSHAWLANPPSFEGVGERTPAKLGGRKHFTWQVSIQPFSCRLRGVLPSDLPSVQSEN